MHVRPIDPGTLRDKVRPPVVVILGSPAEAAGLAVGLGASDVTCYQMDLYPAGRLEQELAGSGVRVVTAADLWDLPATFQTAVYPLARGGERALKLDMIEQAYHVLAPRGKLLVLSPYENDDFVPKALKKVFGRVHWPPGEQAGVFWCVREGERPRRRHEVTFQVRPGGGDSLRFLSRPGVFAYGRLDEGARALVESMTVEPGDRILDVGCGCGTNGVWAARSAGPGCRVTFVDSNLRALALAGHNARANGVADFLAVASTAVEGPDPGTFDLALANPPYFADFTIARLFIRRARELLRPGGRFFLVTRQPDAVGPMVAEAFGPTEALPRRGYVVLGARVPDGPARP